MKRKAKRQRQRERGKQTERNRQNEREGLGQRGKGAKNPHFLKQELGSPKHERMWAGGGRWCHFIVPSIFN